jgi:hypothetical protein
VDNHLLSENSPRLFIGTIVFCVRHFRRAGAIELPDAVMGMQDSVGPAVPIA